MEKIPFEIKRSAVAPNNVAQTARIFYESFTVLCSGRA
jgi:hypothetical protein